MARFSCFLVGFVLFGVACAARIKTTVKDANVAMDACGDEVPGAVHRECHARASFGIFPGFNTCGDSVCKCDATDVIVGEDEACNASLYDEGRKFDPKKVAGKGCRCDHKANQMSCSAHAPQVCDQCKYKIRTAKVQDFADMNVKVDASFPIRIGLPEHGLPKELQGVFWLSDQAASSSLVSFARGEDGGGLGVLSASTGVGKVRVAGDRVWSFSDLGGNMESAFSADLVYAFNFDNATHPRQARIIPEARNMGSVPNWVLRQEWVLKFDMYLLECDKKPDDPHCKDESYLSGYDQSVVWQRLTYVLGVQTKAKPLHDYKAVQVIKPDGTKLPAFQHWMDYSMTAETGGTPGEFHWREIDDSIRCE